MDDGFRLLGEDEVTFPCNNETWAGDAGEFRIRDIRFGCHKDGKRILLSSGAAFDLVEFFALQALGSAVCTTGDDAGEKITVIDRSQEC